MTIYPNKLTEIIYQASGVKLTTAERIAKKITKAGYKSTEEIAEIIKQSAYALSDKHNREVDEARMGYRLPAGKAPLLTKANCELIAANMDDQGDDRYSWQEVRALLKAQNDADNKFYTKDPIPNGWDKNVDNEG